MSGHGQKIGRKQEQAIAALLTCPTIEKAAKSVGLGDATLRRWMKDPGFRTDYREARRQAMEQATAQLQKLGSAAANALRENVEDTEAPHSARVAAARVVFDVAQRGVEIEDLAERIAALEAKSTGQEEKT
jgi:hypothetical protein